MADPLPVFNLDESELIQEIRKSDVGVGRAKDENMLGLGKGKGLDDRQMDDDTR